MDNELLNVNLNKLKVKIDALDLYHSGAKIIDVARKFNFSKNNLYYWLEKESNIRKAYTEMSEIEKLQSNDKTSTDISKIEIDKKMQNLKQLQKKRNYSVEDKLRCIELAKSGCSFADISRKTGFNHSLIKKWTLVELKLLQSKDQLKRKNLRTKQITCKTQTPERMDCKVENVSEESKKEKIMDERMKQQSKNKHVKVDIQTKIGALQMVESGTKVARVAEHFHVNYSTVQYWIESSSKIKQEAETVNECSTASSRCPNELTEIRSNRKAQVISIETKLELFQWKKLLPKFSWDDLSKVFGYHRLLVIGWTRVAHNLISRFQFRRQWRKERLDRLLANTNHKAEICKLKNLLKSENVLEKLSGYLTHGITYSCPKLSRRDCSVFHQKLQKRFNLKTKRRNHVFSRAAAPLLPCEPQPSSELHSVFIELYRDEYEVLCMIDNRYELLTDQRHACDQARRSAIDSDILLLGTHLVHSIHKLISLHQMMIDPP